LRTQPKLIFSTPNCAPIPSLSETTGEITAFNRQNQPNISQAGGKIVADKKHRIFLSIGNFGDAWRSKKVLDSAKNNSKDLFGKIIELRDINQNKMATYRVFSTGFRNPSGLTVIKISGAIIEVENGPEGGDEINRVEFGKNYGWPHVSMGHPYSNSDGTYSFGEFPPYKQTTYYKNSMEPIFSWVPSIAPSNVVETPSSFSLNISGVDELVMGTYRDLSLHFLSISGNALISDEKVFLGYRIRDLTFSSNNTLVILDDNGNIHQLNFEPRKN
jgi:glucose/arabinose dehydrogenase